MNPKGRWKKGETGNPEGRPKGVPNKVTMNVKLAIQSIIENNIDRFQERLDRLEDKDWIKAMTELVKVVVPKNMTVDAGESGKVTINFVREKPKGEQGDNN